MQQRTVFIIVVVVIMKRIMCALYIEWMNIKWSLTPLLCVEYNAHIEIMLRVFLNDDDDEFLEHHQSARHHYFIEHQLASIWLVVLTRISIRLFLKMVFVYWSS